MDRDAPGRRSEAEVWLQRVWESGPAQAWTGHTPPDPLGTSSAVFTVVREQYGQVRKISVTVPVEVSPVVKTIT